MIAVLTARSDAIFQVRVALVLGSVVAVGLILIAAAPRRPRRWRDSRDGRIERLRRSGW